MPSTSQINLYIANGNVLLQQYNSTIVLENEKHKIFDVKIEVYNLNRFFDCGHIQSLNKDLRTNDILCSHIFEVVHLVLGYSILITELP